LVLTPKVLLLDEPLSNLDAQLRYKLREEIREIQQRVGITTVFVTHDQDEALSISDRVAVLSEGRIEQFDTPDNLYLNPETIFVAKFIGSMNVFRATVHNGMVYASGHTVIPCDATTAECNEETELAVRPEDIQITKGTGAHGRVVRRIPKGHYAELILETGVGLLRAFVSNHTQVSETVTFRFKRVLVYREQRLIRSTFDVSSPKSYVEL
jgi:ABC-type Fe3+/spermidine/putrescine transport system ATPase subunit